MIAVRCSRNIMSGIFARNLRSKSQILHFLRRQSPRAGAGAIRAMERIELVSKARGYDLVVMGRFTHPNGLPSDLLQLVLVGCGRPVLIAANNAPQTLTGTVMVCWKDAPEAARAVSVAMPFLAKADRVVIVTVGEGKKSVADSAHAVASQLAWHRVEATAEVASTDGLPVAQVLLSAAQKCRADLLVMGGYSKGRMRETIFGGCTDSILRKADIPVLMLH